MLPTSTARKPREVTGRTVLVWLLVFFGSVFAVNGVMIRAAISTFGGVETTSSYKAGLQFGREIAAANRQDALHWHVDGALKRGRGGDTVLDITVRDASGVALQGLTADVRLAHPADSRLDHAIAVKAIGAGMFHGETDARPGQWELIVDLYRDGERMFRSRSRVAIEAP